MGFNKLKFDLLDSIFTKHWDFHGRRIINAGDAKDNQDYVTLKQLNSRIPTITVGTLYPIDERPSYPVAKDIFISSDFGHTFIYNGTTWIRITASDYVGWFRTAPTEPGWQLCDGSLNVRRSKSNGTTELITVPNLTASRTFASFNATYSGPNATPAVAPTGTIANTTATNTTSITGITINNNTTGITVDDHPDHIHDQASNQATPDLITEDTSSTGKAIRTGNQLDTSAVALTLTHTVNDPQHNHNISDPQHNHIQNAHNHTIVISTTGTPQYMDGLPYIKL
jgi:hypothetical protein